jgi:predicted TIM-barrel fold metal-dependent hydrolase
MVAIVQQDQNPSAASNYIDAHAHVWSDDFDRYPLAPAISVAEMSPRRFLPEELLASARSSLVSRVLLIQMSYYGRDNRYMLDTIRSGPETFRGIAVIDHRSGECLAEMRRLRTLGVRGIRISRAAGDSADWPETGEYGPLFEYAAREGLAVCPLIDPEALPALSRMCARFPATCVIIDHMSRIGMAGPVQDEQVENLCGLARFPDVRIKVSAFYALGLKRPPHADLAELIRRLCEAYGPERLLWGSDCPFQLVEESYEDSISLVRDRLDFLSPEDRQWILRRTAETLFFS